MTTISAHPNDDNLEAEGYNSRPELLRTSEPSTMIRQVGSLCGGMPKDHKRTHIAGIDFERRDIVWKPVVSAIRKFQIQPSVRLDALERKWIRLQPGE